MNSINKRLTISFVAVIMVTSGLLGLYIHREAKTSMINQVEVSLSNKAVDVAMIIENWIESQITEMEMIAALIDRDDAEKMNTTLTQQAGRIGYDSIFMVDETGIVHLPQGGSLDLSHRDYLRKSLAGISNISDPLVSAEDGRVVVMIAVPIYENNQVVGSLLGQINGDYLNGIINRISYGETGNAFMTNNEGTFIAHKDQDLVINLFNPINEAKEDAHHESLSQSVAEAIGGLGGTSNYLYNDINRLMGYAPISNTTWTAYIGVDEDQVMADMNSLMWIIRLYTFFNLILGVVITYFISRSISKPIIELSKLAEVMGALDIRNDIPNKLLSRKDEIGKLARSFQSMTDNLKSFIHQVVDSTDQVAASSEELTAISEQSAMASEHISSSAGEMAMSSEAQLSEVMNVSASMEEISSSIDEVSNNAKEINDLSVSALDKTAIGKKGIQDVILQMNNISSSTQNVQVSLSDITESSKQMSGFTNVIEGIAEQTNLLALNAAIEAARAGDQGKGFAVVAEEVRKLAEESQRSVEKINELINANQFHIQRANQLMEEGAKDVANGIKVVNTTEKTFNEISSIIGSVTNQIDIISSSILQVAQGSQEVVSAAGNIEKMSQDVSSQVQNVSAATEEQTASMEEIASSSQHLSVLAQELQQALTKFKY